MGMMGSMFGGGGGGGGRSQPAAAFNGPRREEMEGPGDVDAILRELDRASAGTPMSTVRGPADQAQRVSVVRDGGNGGGGRGGRRERDMRVSVERSDANTLILNV